MEKNDIFFIIPHYGDPTLTWETVRSLTVAGVQEPCILVLDNSPHLSDLSPVRRAFPAAIWLDGEGDRSFATANNQGAREAAARGAKALFFLNNDTEVERGFLSLLLETFSRFEGKAVVIPTLLYPGAERRIWSQGTHLNRWTGRHIQENENRLQAEVVTPGQEVRRVKGLTGCAFLIATELYLKIGGLDTRYFLYSEDVAFWLKLKAAGVAIYLQPHSFIRHKVSRSTGGASSPVAIYYHFRNRLRLMLEAPEGTFAGTAKIFLVASVLWKGIGWRRAGQSALWRAAVNGLLDGWRGLGGKAKIGPDGRRVREENPT